MWHLTLTKHEPATAHAVTELKSMMETMMAQVDDLAGVLTSIKTDVDALLSRVESLQQELIQLQQTTPPQVDLSGVISQATAIRNELEGISAGADSGSAQPDPTPPVSSSSDGSSIDTSGSSADAGGGTDPMLVDTSDAVSTSDSIEASAAQPE